LIISINKFSEVFVVDDVNEELILILEFDSSDKESSDGSIVISATGRFFEKEFSSLSSI